MPAGEEHSLPTEDLTVPVTPSSGARGHCHDVSATDTHINKNKTCYYIKQSAARRTLWHHFPGVPAKEVSDSTLHRRKC